MYETFGLYYDLITADYAAAWTGRELAFLRWAFGTLSKRPVCRVLDLGAGTGRLALPLAQAGLEVTALDQSATMLSQLQAKAIAARTCLTLTEARMEEVDQPCGYDALICCHDTFAHLTTDKQLESALRQWRGALREGGLFLFDLSNPFHGPCPLLADRVAHYAAGTVRLLRHRTVRVDDVSCLAWVDELGWVDDEGRHQTYHETIPLRLFSTNEVLLWLNRADWVDVRVFRGYDDRGDFVGSSERLVFVARKP